MTALRLHLLYILGSSFVVLFILNVFVLFFLVSVLFFLLFDHY